MINCYPRYVSSYISVVIHDLHFLFALSQFFMTEPYACDPSSLPQYPPTKEMDAKRRDDEARRSRCFDFYLL